MNELIEIDDGAFENLELTLFDVQSSRLHLGAMVEILSKCDPAYKIEAGLYLGNLRAIHDRLAHAALQLDARVYAGQR